MIIQGIKFAMVNGQGTRFWQYIWLLDKPLIEVFQRQVEEGEASRVVWDYTGGVGERNWHILNNLFNEEVLVVLQVLKLLKLVQRKTTFTRVSLHQVSSPSN